MCVCGQSGSGAGASPAAGEAGAAAGAGAGADRCRAGATLAADPTGETDRVAQGAVGALARGESGGHGLYELKFRGRSSWIPMN